MVLGMSAVTALACPRPAEAQLTPRLERCLPYPSFAQEVAETTVAEDKEVQDHRDKIVIADVRFQGDTKLNEVELEKVKSFIQRGELNAGPAWPDEVAEVSQSLWQDRGYYRAKVTAIGINLGHDANSERDAVVLQVSAGHPYRTGKVSFRTDWGPMAFPESELSKIAELRSGDIFSVAMVHKVFDRLKNIYGDAGYIDFTSEPRFNINDADGIIDVDFILYQERQYRISSVTILGLDSRTESEMRSALPLGGVFNAGRLNQFLSEHRSKLPDDWSPQEIRMIRNVKLGTVELTFDFQSCPHYANR
jgi:outer membrane protein assembly factor BamA